MLNSLIRNLLRMSPRLVTTLSSPYTDRHQAQSLMDAASLQGLDERKEGIPIMATKTKIAGPEATLAAREPNLF